MEPAPAVEPRHHPLCGIKSSPHNGIEFVNYWVCVSDCAVLAAQAKLPLV